MESHGKSSASLQPKQNVRMHGVYVVAVCWNPFKDFQGHYYDILIM
jgi:hypothetical protein